MISGVGAGRLRRLVRVLAIVASIPGIARADGAQDKIAAYPLFGQFARRLYAKKLYQCPNVAGFGGIGYVCCRISAENWDTPLHEELQQITVIARDLVDLASGIETKAALDHMSIFFGVLHPRRRIG